MIDDVLSLFNSQSEKTISAFTQRLGTFRTGRASTALVENMLVDSYGTKMPLKSLASISVPEAKMILVQPWDRNNIVAIEKAILTSDLGLSPQTEGGLIRIIVPPLTGERREEFKRLIKQEAENARVSIRGHRKVAMDLIKSKKEAKELTEDQEEKAKESLQTAVDAQIAMVDSLLTKKLTELDQV